MKRWILFCCLLSALQLVGAQVSLTGVLTDSLGTAITQESTVTLLTKKDLLKVAQGKVSQGHFMVEFTPCAHVEYVLYVFALGYRDCYLDVTNKQGDLGKICLAPLSVALREVIVKPGRLQHDIVNGNDVFKVSGTELAQEHSVTTLLLRLPGITMDAERKIKVVGVGNPIYTINGEKPRPGEWEAITPDQIDKVTINTMPSVKYEAKVNSVVDIRLKKRLKDYLSVNLRNMTDFTQHCLEENPNIDINIGTGKFSTYIGYGHMYSYSREPSTDTKEVIQLSDGTRQIQETNWLDGLDLNWQHRVNVAPKYQFNDKSYLDVQYALSYSKYRMRDDNRLFRSEEAGGEIRDEHTMQLTQSLKHTYNHDLSARYVYTFSESDNLSVNVGYSKNQAKDDQHVEETLNEQTEYIIGNQKANSETFTATVDYQTMLWKKLVLNVGGIYSFLTSDNQNVYNTMDDEDRLVETKERTTVGYVDVSQTLGCFHYAVGLRGEYQSRTSDYHGLGKTDVEHTFYLVPKLGLNYRPSQAWSMNLSYNYSRINPSAVDLDPTVYYINKYMYETGNPDLKPAEAHSSRFRMSHLPTNLALTVNYGYVKSIHFVFMNDEQNPQVIKQTLKNHTNSSLDVALSYYHRWGIYTLSCNGGYKQEFSKDMYLGKNISYSKPQIILGMSNYFSLPKGFSLQAALGYESKSVSFPQENNEKISGRIFLGYSHKNLSMNLGAFVKNRGEVYQKCGYIDRAMRFGASNTQFFFSLIYRINQYKNLFQKNDVNAEAVSRSIMSY